MQVLPQNDFRSKICFGPKTILDPKLVGQPSRNLVDRASVLSIFKSQYWGQTIIFQIQPRVESVFTFENVWIREVFEYMGFTVSLQKTMHGLSQEN